MALTRPKYSQIYDSDFKNSCRVATTTNVTLSGGAPSTVDGISLAVNDRVLVRSQSTTSQNGIYFVATLGTGANGTWTRALDAIDGSRLTSGTTLSIEEGSTQGGKMYRMTTPNPITVGTSPIQWTDVSGGGVASGSNGQIQYNNLGALSGTPNLAYMSATGQVIANAGIESTSTASGTMLVSGGAGVSGNLYVNRLYTTGLYWSNNNSIVNTNLVSNPTIYVGTATATTSATLVDTLPVTANVFLRWTLTAKDTVNNRFTSTVVDSVNDGANVYYTQYGTIKSNPSFNVATFTSNISGGNINLYSIGDSASVAVTFQRVTLGTNSMTGYINTGPFGGTGGGSAGTVTSVAGTGTVSGITLTGNVTTSGSLTLGGALDLSSPPIIGGSTPAASSFTTTTITGTTTSVSTSTGALVVAGGAGVGGSIYAGSVYDNNSRVVTGLASSGAGNLSIGGSAPSLTVSLPTSGPGAITVGSSTNVPVITTDAYGRIVSLSTAAVSAGSSALSIAGTSGTGNVALASQTLTINGSLGVTASASGQTITVSTPQDLQTTSSPQFVGGTYTGNVNVGSLFSSTAPTNTTSALTLTGAPNTSTSGKAGVLSVGPNFTASDKNIIATFVQSINDYAQVIVQNPNAGTAASADFIVNNDNTVGSGTYGDFGINSSAFTGAGSLQLANATYLYSVGGELVLGTQGANGIRFVTNNATTDAATITSAGVFTATNASLTTPAVSGATYSTNNNFVAGTNAQGQGAITTDNVVVGSTASNPSGVTLPAATTGRMITIVNKGANPVNIYPAAGGQIDALGANASLQLPVGEWIEFNAASGTQWYSTINAIINASALNGTVPLANGGTGGTDTQSATNNIIGYTSTATAGGTTTFTASSTVRQIFTGTAAQTITLPVTTTLQIGYKFEIINNSTNVLTVNSSGGNLVGTISPGAGAKIRCILNSGTTAAPWDMGWVDLSVDTRLVPQVSSTGNLTVDTTHISKHIYHPAAAAAATYIIPANASIPFEIGTVLSFVNMSTNAVTISITTDTMYLAGSGTTGNRTLAQYGMATALKLTATTWIISGSGLT